MGLEGLIPDGKADDIINNDDVVDAFKDEDYDTGVSQVVDEVFGIMNTKTALVDSQIKNVESQRTKLMFFHWTGVVILGLLVFVSLLLVVNLLRARVFSKKTIKNINRKLLRLLVTMRCNGLLNIRNSTTFY